ncbi:hypothetical protein ACFFRR_004592 [Megaselia abdita]
MSRLLRGLFIAFISDIAYSLHISEIRVPKHVVTGADAQLECRYDLGGDALYSVKWYKDGNEFYRYVPRDMPPAQVFKLPGVHVVLGNSTDSVVSLRGVDLLSSGRYKCEVSGEAPLFQTVSDHGSMLVVYLPDKEPTITGGRAKYQIGDWVSLNCTSGRSKPAVELDWYINGEEAKVGTLRKYNVILSGREGLETSTLGLTFRVDHNHFRHGDMKLKCVARMFSMYWRSNEESVQGDRPLKAPVLESRETVVERNSRAESVKASSTRTIYVSSLLYLVVLSFTVILFSR